MHILGCAVGSHQDPGRFLWLRGGLAVILCEAKIKVCRERWGGGGAERQ